MNDPHVVDLTYDLVVVDPTVTFKNPPPVELDSTVAHLVLSDGVLTATMREHYPNDGDARAAVENVLRAWELRDALKSGLRRIHFRYRHSNVIDRDPPPPGTPQGILVEGHDSAVFGDILFVDSTLSKYPDPPIDFVRTPEVDALSARWLTQRAGKEPLLSCAYFVLTFFERKFGDRAAAGAALAVSGKVLTQLGKLASHYGDETTARKVVDGAQKLTAVHESWIAELIPELIRRLAIMPVSQPGPLLTLDQLPALPD